MDVDNTLIYSSTVDALGLPLDSDDQAFKTEILMHINAALAILVQAGCGVDTYADENTTWDAFFGYSTPKGMAKNFVFVRTRILFDPPSSSFTLKAMQDNLDELIWRITVEYSRSHPYVPDTEDNI